MEQNETLGKRIAALRKAHGWTQEQLAEKIGISAQAVSKWENDLSCPDVMTLPLLAKLFGVSVDGLLGITPAEPQVVIVNQDKKEEKGKNGKFTWEWELSSFSGVTGCVTAILIGLTLLVRELKPALFPADTGVWSLVWPLILLWPGLSMLCKKRPFPVAAGVLLVVYGVYEFTYTLLGRPEGWPVIGWYAILLALAVLYLFFTMFRKSGTKKGGASKSPTLESSETDTEFTLSASFGGNTVVCTAPELNHAHIETSFGDYTVDMTGAHLKENALIEAEVSFGNLTLLCPADMVMNEDRDASFGSVSMHGTAPSSGVKVLMKSSVSFGNIDIRYPDA